MLGFSLYLFICSNFCNDKPCSCYYSWCNGYFKSKEEQHIIDEVQSNEIKIEKELKSLKDEISELKTTKKKV